MLVIANLNDNNDSLNDKFAGNRLRRSYHNNFWLIQNLIPTANCFLINNQKPVDLFLYPLTAKA